MKTVDLRDIHGSQITKEVVERRLLLTEKQMAVVLKLFDLIDDLFKEYINLPEQLAKVTKKEDRIIGFMNGYITILKNVAIMLNGIMTPQDIEEIFNDKELGVRYKLIMSTLITTKFTTDETQIDVSKN